MRLKLFRYFFPRQPLQTKLPLLSRDWSSELGRHAALETDQHDIDMLIGHGVARTVTDAKHKLKEYRFAPVGEIIRAEKRKRRRPGRMTVAIRQFRKLFQRR